MSVVNVAIKDLGKYEAKLASQLPKAVRAGMTRGAHAVVAQLQMQSAITVSTDLGGFIRGWQSLTLSDFAVRVHNVAPHAAFVEFGRGPGAPPPAYALMPWVTRHLGDPSIAFAVARAIGRRGIKARPVMFAPGMDKKMSAVMLERLTDTLDRVLAP